MAGVLTRSRSCEEHREEDNVIMGRRLEWYGHKPRNTEDCWELPEARERQGVFPRALGGNSAARNP